MSVTLTRYLVDSNVLSRLSRDQRRSRFFRTNCLLCTEVLYETDGFPDHTELSRLEYPITTAVLVRVRDVMATVEPGDFKLVDLYRNLGNADPILVASALEMMAAAADTLFDVDCRIVSDDAAVVAKAKDFQVKTLGYRELSVLIQSSQPDQPEN